MNEYAISMDIRVGGERAVRRSAYYYFFKRRKDRWRFALDVDHPRQ